MFSDGVLGADVGQESRNNGRGTNAENNWWVPLAARDLWDEVPLGKLVVLHKPRQTPSASCGR